MATNSKTLILWGAGATATLGMRTTKQQARFIGYLASDRKDLEWRISKAIDNSDSSFACALSDLMNILGDGNKLDKRFVITSEQMQAMRRNWTDNKNEELTNRILNLRQQYDWPTLKSVIRICPGWDDDPEQANIELSDLFNILDMHDLSGHGFHFDNQFLSPSNIKGAQNALKLLLLTSFYIDWQDSLKDEAKCRERRHHYRFAEKLGGLMQQKARQRIGNHNPESPKFYLDNIAFASLNFDPIALWLQYVANRDLNKSPSVPHIGKHHPARRLQIYHDLGHIVPSRRINCENPNFARFSMNEATAQRLNDPDHKAEDLIYVSKFLFPHGCLVWRECPSCGKLSSFLGDRWEADSPTLFIPPPLKSFEQNMPKTIQKEKEKKEYEQGAIDVRACVHCGTPTYAYHTQVLMQSNFKTAPPPFIEEIQRELRILVENAEHIIFMGYSLPSDDVEYRAFFAARRHRCRNPSVKCSVVGLDSRSPDWLNGSIPRNLDGPNKDTLEAAHKLFGKDNVRFYGGGIPQVFIDGGQVTDRAIERLLQWDSA